MGRKKKKEHRAKLLAAEEHVDEEVASSESEREEEQETNRSTSPAASANTGRSAAESENEAKHGVPPSTTTTTTTASSSTSSSPSASAAAGAAPPTISVSYPSSSATFADGGRDSSDLNILDEQIVSVDSNSNNSSQIPQLSFSGVGSILDAGDEPSPPSLLAAESPNGGGRNSMTGIPALQSSIARQSSPASFPQPKHHQGDGYEELETASSVTSGVSSSTEQQQQQPPPPLPQPSSPKLTESTPPRARSSSKDGKGSIELSSAAAPVAEEANGAPSGGGGGDDIGRTVLTNKPNPGFCSNLVVTSKYTALNFLPLNLYHQFKRIANFYFLMIGVLQCIPAVSPLGVTRPTILVPLTIVLATSAVKEAIEDFRRRRQDNDVNNKLVEVLRDPSTTTHSAGAGGSSHNDEESSVGGKSWVRIAWKEVVVGDIVRVNRDESIPADLVLLASDNEFGLCYVETSNLDGETNLKQREALPQTAKRFQQHEECCRTQLKLRCEDPNNRLYNFDGSLEDEAGRTYALSPNQIMLRGCSLRNSKWVVGVAINTGSDTKLMRNAVPSPIKQSNIEKLTNKKIFIAFMADFVACTILAIGNVIWSRVNASSMWYLELNPDNVVLPAFISLFTNLINFNGMIPISLYVSMELVKLAQMYFMGEDVEMYYEPADTPCMARTSNLNEELGQVEYIFSDKTGTLTRNVMEFRACSVAGRRYQVDPTRNDDARKSPLIENMMAGQRGGDVAVRGVRGPSVNLDDQQQGGGAEGSGGGGAATTTAMKRYASAPTMVSPAEGETIEDFLLVLSLCHGVIIERSESDPSKFTYQAASPDENALVDAARVLGFVFVERSPTSVTIEVLGERRVYELLNIIDFTSARKRMTVIVRSPLTNKITLYCKGADNVICDRCRKEDQPHMPATLAHLEEYAVTGLRTLCLAKRELTDEQWSSWNEVFHEASVAIKDREQKVGEAAELIEKELFLLGGTAIEDRLQDHVPETIHTLSKAGIKVWVLTGDKQETAINIGHSCALLARDTELLILNASDAEGAHERVVQLQERVEELKRRNQFTSAEEDALAAAEAEREHGGGGGGGGKSASTTAASTAAPGVELEGDSDDDESEDGDREAGDVEMTPIVASPRDPSEAGGQSSANNTPRSLKGEGGMKKRNGKARNGGGGGEKKASSAVTTSVSSPGPPPTSSSKKKHKYEPDKLLKLGLVVDGPTLLFIMDSKSLAKEFLQLACQCRSVICCRVSPIQKAEVVKLVRDNMPVITLAIGDGANDVSMIQAAHLGIGISGREGLQATLASDYAIAQFSFLQRLLLVHGRWAYRRVSELIVYSFYKNFTFVLSQFWYGIFTGFSGQLFFDDLLDGSYNIFFTGLPIIAYAALDQDVPAHVSLRCPWLYLAGQQERRFNQRVFVTWLVNGAWHSFLLFFGAYLSFRTITSSNPEVGFIGLWDLGTVTYTGVVFAVSARLAIEVTYWTWINVVVFLLCFLAYFSLSLIRSALTFPDTYYSGVMINIISRPSLWLYVGVITIVCVMLRDYSWKYYKHTYKSEHNHIAQLEYYREKKARRKAKRAAKKNKALAL